MLENFSNFQESISTDTPIITAATKNNGIKTKLRICCWKSVDVKNEPIPFSKTNRKASNFEKEIKDKATDIEESYMLSFKGAEQ